MVVEGIFSTPTALFDLYHLFVEVVFGGVGISIIGIAFVLILILLICRSSLLFLVIWIGFYLAVMGMLYLGGLAMVIMTIIGFVYAATSVIRAVLREGAV